MEFPCKFTWRVVIGWVPAEGNELACPAEEHCDGPPNPPPPGTVDGSIWYGACLGTAEDKMREAVRLTEGEERPG
jgi:hypothetical protein